MINSTLAVKPVTSHLKSSSKNSSDTLAKVTNTHSTMEKETLQKSLSQTVSSTPHYTPIWDYDRFPIEPCFRERNNRTSQEHLNPFLIDYTQYHCLQGNSSNGEMARTPSSSSAKELGNYRYSRHSSPHESRHGSRNISSHDLGISISTPNTNVVSLQGSPSPSPSSPSRDGADAYADPFMHISVSHHTQAFDYHDESSPPVVISKFDQYKAQMERLRSTRVSSSSPSNSRQPSMQTDASATASPSPTKKSTRFIPKLLKRGSKSKSTSSNVTQSSSPSMSSSRSSLNEKLSPPTAPQLAPRTHSSSRSSTEKNSTLDSDGCEPQRSPLEEQQDRWRDEWLRPSGAIHSMFGDKPSKFDCPHCGAIKVVSHVQFTPGVMSCLVAFGLLFLTLGTLSFIPFRKDHEGTKDCIHWCPECAQKVARFNRANATWEWV
ncbi:hypothetical protein BGX26_010484 [Mortierella sp. AD094]|nr:hypothetical protein BGX26_010484 [Mortierella sp. AD094]